MKEDYSKMNKYQIKKVDNNIRRIVILGHNGFIGSHLMQFFNEQLKGINVIGRSLPEIDLTKQEDVMSLANMFDCETAVVMCSCIKKQLGDSLDIFKENLKMVTNLCRLLKDNPVRRFIYLSSAEVYGEDINNTNINEATPVNPRSYYGIVKYTSECLLHKVIRSNGKGSLLILRPPLIYGPGDRTRGYGPSGFICSAKNAKEIRLWGDGEELREFIFVHDLARIVYSLLFHKYEGIANVASGNSHTFKEILDVISHLVSSGLKISSHSRSKSKIDNEFSNKLLKDLLPDFAFTSLKEGIRLTFDSEKTESVNSSMVENMI